VLLLDIDHFKRVNDIHGHKTGDLVPQALAGIMQKTLRKVDTIGRIGGEEFAIILLETEAATALEVAERLRTEVAETEIESGNSMPLQITVSIGIALPLDRLNPIDNILRQADSALYEAKNSGRNRVCVAESAH
jgi:diguanylate cyclase (GGDEF)-like protein